MGELLAEEAEQSRSLACQPPVKLWNIDVVWYRKKCERCQLGTNSWVWLTHPCESLNSVGVGQLAASHLRGILCATVVQCCAWLWEMHFVFVTRALLASQLSSWFLYSVMPIQLKVWGFKVIWFNHSQVRLYLLANTHTFRREGSKSSG